MGISFRKGIASYSDTSRAQRHRELKRDPNRRFSAAEPEQVALECALLCGECGQLGWRKGMTSGAPHRYDDAAGIVGQDVCTNCKQQCWIDLGRGSVAMVLQTEDEDRADVRRSVARHIFRRGLTGAVFGGVLGAVAIGAWWGVAVVAALAGSGVALTVYRRVAADATPVCALPSRWTMALPPEGATTQVVNGPATVGELLSAPLTGRSCVAYEVGARYDSNVAAPIATWALLEQKVVALQIEGSSLVPAETHLRLERKLLGTAETLALDEAALAFLRRRGLQIGDPALELYESIIAPGASVRATLVGTRATLEEV